jgi:hypothetical protein
MGDKLLQLLFDAYSNYKLRAIENKRFSHSNFMNALRQFENSKVINISTAGYSVEGREIKLIKIGSGKTNVMAWSQMHGNESTATMALLDFFNFIETDVNDEFAKLRKEILNELTLFIIPMLNPDGAELFCRENGIGIDLNRDALQLQSPESKILKKIQEEVRPTFAFNLHDQGNRYSVGNSNKSAAIAFLAPAYNHEKNINSIRKNAMKLISQLTVYLEKFIDGHIAKYNDDFEPRAFGDNFVKWGSSLVLIESGGIKNNYEKSFIRKLNFIALISGFELIATEGFKNNRIDKYQNIPENQQRLYDLLLRNVTIEKNGEKYLVDIGVNHNEVGTFDNRDFYFVGSTEEIGDLSTFCGFKEVDCSGMTINRALIYPEKFDSIKAVLNSDVVAILKKGYSFIQVSRLESVENFSTIPINLIKSDKVTELKFGVGKRANFRLCKNGKVIYNCVNGFLFGLESKVDSIKNGLIIK